MKKDEKTCPKCAETIKLAALVCKHCGAEFSPSDVELHKAELAKARRDKKIDAGIEDVLYFELANLDGEEIRPHEIQKLADEIGISYKHVLGRVIEHGAEFVDKPAPLAPHDWSESTAVAIDSELRAAAEDGVVATDRMLEIADRHDVTGVSDRIRWLGLAYVNGLGEIVDDDYERNKAAAKAAKFRQWDADAMVAASRKGIVADSQYGVLQGAANVAGGCATGWGILFALLAIVLVIFAISQVFSAIF